MGVLYAKVAGGWEPILAGSTGGGGGDGTSQWEPGDVKSTMKAVPSPGWLMLDGTSHPNADTAYPDLWAVVPATWKSGTTLVLPNAANRVLMGGGTLGTVGGANTRTLVEGNLPAHDHSIAHTHTINHGHATANTGSASGHVHDNWWNQAWNAPTGGTTGKIVGAGPDYNNPSGSSGSHTHSSSTPNHTGSSGASSAGNSGNAGSGTAIDTTPANLRVNYMVKT